MKLRSVEALVMMSAVAAGVLVSCKPTPETIPLGIQLWSLRAQLLPSLPSGLAMTKALGFTLVETAGTYGHTPKEFRSMAEANGLKIVGSHIGYDRMQSDLPGVIAEVKALGASYVCVAWIPHEGDFTVAMAKAAAANFNTWGAALKAEGLGFGFHTHGYEFKPLPDGSSAFDVLINETKPDLVFCEMDVFWVAQPGLDPVKLLQKYPTRFKAFHIKDMRKGAPTGLYEGKAPASDNVIVGQGSMDWPAIIAEGRRDGVQYYLIEDETSDPVNNIPPSIKYLEKLGLKP
ncbi:MAG TPA: sugar phosphate isomerase/epimerase [Opitutaceae bacterium]|nr:sugar phosphate isomerase/epimerase [Opitutaceae bacterium]